MNYNLKIGADPEVFLQDKFGNPQTAIGLIGGTKINPLPITPHGHNIQEDNVAAEFNIPACMTAAEVYDNIEICLNHIKEKVSVYGLSLSTKASCEFTEEQLDSEQAQVFGCDPDINAYTMLENIVNCPNKLLRSVGGHIHVSYDDHSQANSIEIIFWLDLLLGVPSLFLDKDTKRRELYGKAGAFRFKPYGFEYRTLSNFWIFSRELVQFVFDAVETAVINIKRGKFIDIDDLENIEKAINENNTEIAKELIDKYEIKILNNVCVD